MANEALGGEDAAWLHMDDATNPMVVSGLLELAAPLSLHRAHVLLERLATIPRFRARVVEPSLHVGPPSWEPVPDFDLTEHVEQVALDAVGDVPLRAFVSKVVSERLDLSRPLWRVYLVDRPGAGTTLLFRVHHAIGDGFALLDVFLSLCDHGDAKSATPPSIARRRARRRDILPSLHALQRLVTLPADPKTALRAALHSEKRIAWSAPLLLADVKSVAHACSATVNDVLVAVLAGSLGRYLAQRGERTSGLELHAMVPVNVRPAGRPMTIDNCFGLVLLGLPIGVEDPLVRVTAVKQRMKALKGTPEARVSHGLLRVLGWAPHVVEDLAASFFGKKASVVLTNVPGPRQVLSLDGIPISRMMFWVPEAARIGLGISIFSYAGEVTVGVLSDAGVVPDPEAIVANLHAEFASLASRVRAEARTERSRTRPS